MNDGLLAALRDGVAEGSIPRPIDGESIDDFRFRTAHAGAIIGIKWAYAQAAAAEEHAPEPVAVVPDSPAEIVQDYWRPGDATVVPVGRHTPPEQDEVGSV